MSIPANHTKAAFVIRQHIKSCSALETAHSIFCRIRLGSGKKSIVMVAKCRFIYLAAILVICSVDCLSVPEPTEQVKEESPEHSDHKKIILDLTKKIDGLTADLKEMVSLKLCVCNPCA